MKAIICDVCDKQIDKWTGYRKIKSVYSDGSLHRVEHICDDCWNEIAVAILKKKGDDK